MSFSLTSNLAKDQMPKLSEFFGNKITMYADEHGIAHFHAHHAGRVVVIGIDPLTVLAGGIRPRQFGLVMKGRQSISPN